MHCFCCIRTLVIGLLAMSPASADQVQPATASLSNDSANVAGSTPADSTGLTTDTIGRATIPRNDAQLTTAVLSAGDTSAIPAQRPVPETAVPDTVHPATDPILRIAVADFFGRGVDSSTALGLSDRCRLLLSNYSALPVMGLREMEDSLARHSRSSGRVCDHNDCLVETGRMLGVRYIVGGSAGSMGDLLTLAIRLLDVRTGRVLLFELLDTPLRISDVLTVQLPAIVVEFNNKVSSASSATIALQSEPSGATVKFDQTPVGKTPLLIKNVTTGTHDIRLSMDHYREVIDTFTLEKMERGGKRYVLKLTDDAVSAYREKCRILWALRGVGVLGGIAALSAGLHYDSRLGQIETERQIVVDEYTTAGNDTDKMFFTERLRHQEKLYERCSAYRNFSFVAAAALSAGVGVTFLF